MKWTVVCSAWFCIRVIPVERLCHLHVTGCAFVKPLFAKSLADLTWVAICLLTNGHSFNTNDQNGNSLRLASQIHFPHQKEKYTLHLAVAGLLLMYTSYKIPDFLYEKEGETNIGILDQLFSQSCDRIYCRHYTGATKCSLYMFMSEEAFATIVWRRTALIFG